MFKKIVLSLMSIFLLAGCSFSSSNDPSKVKSITLELISTEFYKGEPIEILMEVDSGYQLTEEDFNIFGGSIEIKNKNTAFLTYNSAGTFHVSCTVGDVQSNELTIQVRTNTSSIGTSTKPNNSTNKPDSSQGGENKTKDPNDFTDWENVRDASSDKIMDANSIDSYINEDILIEGEVPQGSDGTYIVTSDGQKLTLSGLEMMYAGPVRLYGSYDGNTFHVRSYVSFGGEDLNSEENQENEE